MKHPTKQPPGPTRSRYFRRRVSFDDDDTIDEAIHKIKYITILDIQKFLKERGVYKSLQTIRRWAIQHKLGRKLGREWLIDRYKWERFFNGQD